MFIICGLIINDGIVMLNIKFYNFIILFLVIYIILVCYFEMYWFYGVVYFYFNYYFFNVIFFYVWVIMEIGFNFGYWKL